MNKQKLFGIVASATIAVALIAYAAYVLVGLYSDVLLTAQDRNVFSDDSQFFGQQIVRPFGLIQYVGAYLTQYFFHPALGAAMLIAIWAVSALVGIKALGLKGIWRSLIIVPVACLLASEVDLGYWVYCLNITGYWFSQSLGFLCLVLLLWAASATPRKYRLAWYVLIGFVLFPVFGWISYLFVVCFALSQFAKTDKKWTTPTWIDALGIAFAVAAPFVFRLFNEALLDEEIFNAGFPFFKTAADSSIRPSYPFFVLAGTMVFLSLGRALPAMKKIPSWTTSLLVGAASAYGVWTTIFQNDNYIYEMQMTQATMNEDWQKVVSVAEKAERPSRAMVMLKNIALLNTNQLTRSFELGNDGIDIYNPDKLNLNIMHIASPVIYYNHGIMNYATRWCIEFGVPYGFSPFFLKILAQSAKVSGEEELMRRYVKRLHSMTFYRDWQPAPPSPVVKELHSVCEEFLDNDENNCERYLISQFCTHHYASSPYYTELSLVYAMITCTPKNFWASLDDYLATHPDKRLPEAYGEAFYLFINGSKEKYPGRVDIAPAIPERFQKFWEEGERLAQSGFTKEAVGNSLRADWGDTYWWFNAFGRMEY